MIRSQELGGHRFAVAGIALEYRQENYGVEAKNSGSSVQENGSFYELVNKVFGTELGAEPVAGSATAAAGLTAAQPQRKNFDSSPVLGGDAPMDRDMACQIPDNPLEPSLLENLVQMVTSFFVGTANASEACPETPPPPRPSPPPLQRVTENIAPPVTMASLENGAGVEELMLPRKTPYDAIIQRAAELHDVDESLIRAVIAEESRFNPSARSREGAMGLMQLMPRTATELGVRKPFNPEENIMGGTLYLARLLDRYDGNLKLALAAYNWGPGNLEQNPGRVPKVTQRYIANVMARVGNDEAALNS